MAIIRLIVTYKILLCNDQPDDDHELAETCRILIRIYFLHTTVVLLTTFNIYNNLYEFFFSPISSTYPTHLIFLDLISMLTSDIDWKT